MKSFGRSTILTTMVIMAGMASFFLFTEVNSTASENLPNEIRMTVDPTVLPPVTPPDMGESEPESVPAAPEQPQVELPDIEERTPMPAPSAEKASAPESEPEPQAEAAPAATQADEPEVEVTPASDTLSEQVVTPAPADAGKGAVTRVTMNSTDAKLVLTVYCNRPVGDTTYMNLTNPRRLVVDLREPWDLKTRNVVRVKSGAVKHVVMGSHPDRLRLVVHFRTPPTRNLQPTFERIGNKLIVTAQLP